MGQRDDRGLRMMEGGYAGRGGNGLRELAVYVCWGGYLEEGGDRMLSYRGGMKDCIWVKENMPVVHVERLVEEVIGEGLKGQEMWYSMKYDKREVLLLGKDVDVTKLMKGNEEYAYIYVGGKEGSFVRRLHDSATVGMGGMHEGTFVEGTGKRTVAGRHTVDEEVVGGTLGRGSGNKNGNK